MGRGLPGKPPAASTGREVWLGDALIGAGVVPASFVVAQFPAPRVGVALDPMDACGRMRPSLRPVLSDNL